MDAPIGAYKYTVLWAAWKNDSLELLYTNTETPNIENTLAYVSKDNNSTSYNITEFINDTILVNGVIYNRESSQDSTYFNTIRIEDGFNTYDLYIARFLANLNYNDGTGYFNDINISNKFGTLFAWSNTESNRGIIYTTNKNPEENDTVFYILDDTVYKDINVITTRKYNASGVFSIKFDDLWFDREVESDNKQYHTITDTSLFDDSETKIIKIKNIFKLDGLKFVSKQNQDSPIGFVGYVKYLYPPVSPFFNGIFHNLNPNNFYNGDINRSSGLILTDTNNMLSYDVLNDAGLNTAGTYKMLLATSNSVYKIDHIEDDNTFHIYYYKGSDFRPSCLGGVSQDGIYERSNYNAWPYEIRPRINDCKIWGNFTASFYNITTHCGAMISNNNQLKTLREIKVFPKHTRWCQGFGFSEETLSQLEVSQTAVLRWYDVETGEYTGFRGAISLNSFDIYGINKNEEMEFINLWDEHNNTTAVLFPLRYNFYVGQNYTHIDLLGGEISYIYKPISVAYPRSGASDTESMVMARAATRYKNRQFLLTQQVDLMQTIDDEGKDNAYSITIPESGYLGPTADYTMSAYQEVLLSRAILEIRIPGHEYEAEEAAFAFFDPTSENIVMEGNSFEGIEYRYLGISNKKTYNNWLINMSNMANIPSHEFVAAVALEGYTYIDGIKTAGVWILSLYVPPTSLNNVCFVYIRDIKSITDYVTYP